MIAVSEAAVVALVVAGISAAASIIGGYFAYKARQQTKTSNGHTSGELTEQIHDRLARIEIWMVEHLTDHANSASTYRQQRTSDQKRRR